MSGRTGDADPHRIIFIGSVGVGKSTAINLLINPSGDAEVPREGTGERCENQQVTQILPAEGYCVTVKHHEQDLALMVTEVPGLNNAEQQKSEVMQEISHALVEMSVGIDAIVHVVRMGCLSELDRMPPELLLTGLTSSRDDRQELADRWVFLVTHCGGEGRNTTEEEIEQFRVEMRAYFPEVLHQALARAIFVENGCAAADSPYSNAEINRGLILDYITSFRQTYNKCFSSPNLDNVVRASLREAVKIWNESIETSLQNMPIADVASFIKLFKVVKNDGRFRQIGALTTSDDDFRERWNCMGFARREKTAVQIARRVTEKVENEPKSFFEQFFTRRIAEDALATSAQSRSLNTLPKPVSSANNPVRVVRPIQPLDNPHMCLHCKQLFSKKEFEDAVKESPHCPRCHEPLEMGKTLVPSQEDMVAAKLDGTMSRHADDADPHRIIFTGSFGVGKSTAINLLIDPSGETELAKEGNGARGETQHVTQVFPADGQSGILRHHDRDLALVVTDTPGFNDPGNKKKDAQLMQEMSLSVGVDAIIHVVKMGRMAERDRELPELLLSGIASSADGRQELADRWVFLVTNCDGKPRKKTTRDEVEQFRGQMQAFFPEILHKALSRAIFVENGGAGRDSPFGDAEKNRELILDQVISFRQTYHRCFSPSLDKVVRTALDEAMSTLLPRMSNADVATLIKFFKTVKQEKKFQPMPSMVSAEEPFIEKWNSMDWATRDATAVRIAGKVLEKLKEPAYFRHRWKGNADGCSVQ